MKSVVAVLILLAVLAAIAAVTGLEHGSYVGNRYVVTYHSAGGRVAAAVFGVICGIAAHGCTKRKMYAWQMVTAMLILLAAFGVGWTVWKMATAQGDFVGNALGSVGEGVKIAAVIWFLVGWWLPRKKLFS